MKLLQHSDPTTRSLFFKVHMMPMNLNAEMFKSVLWHTVMFLHVLLYEPHTFHDKLPKLQFCQFNLKRRMREGNIKSNALFFTYCLNDIPSVQCHPLKFPTWFEESSLVVKRFQSTSPWTSHPNIHISMSLSWYLNSSRLPQVVSQFHMAGWSSFFIAHWLHIQK